MNFDEASTYWRKNKINIGNGFFTYRCMYIHNNGKTCGKAVEYYDRLKKTENMHPDWNTTIISKDIYRFCKRHKVSGPLKEYLLYE
jgi:hypothetical protein